LQACIIFPIAVHTGSISVWTVFFMRKNLKRVGFCLLLCGFLWGIMIVKDKHALQKQLIRLHVVAASDSVEDQTLKLRVRDAVIASLRSDMENLLDVHQARAYLQDKLPMIERVANQVLNSSGADNTATVSLEKEEFPVRYYDTFTLPSGIYETLRITIGNGDGHNWWCVVFPALCVGATVDDFEETAQCAGLPDSLTQTLGGDANYEVRFLVLDALGKLENFLHRG